MSEVEIDIAANAGMETKKMAKHPAAEICGGDCKPPRTAESGGPKKMARVPQEHIDWLIEGFKLRPPGPVRGMAKSLSKLGDGDNDVRLRKTLEETAAALKRAQDADLDIIAQYRAKGYAEVEVE